MAEVLERSPAESAGILAGDVLIAYVAVARMLSRCRVMRAGFPPFSSPLVFLVRSKRVVIRGCLTRVRSYDGRRLNATRDVTRMLGFNEGKEALVIACLKPLARRRAW